VSALAEVKLFSSHAAEAFSVGAQQEIHDVLEQRGFSCVAWKCVHDGGVYFSGDVALSSDALSLVGVYLHPAFPGNIQTQPERVASNQKKEPPIF
jgi:hypothetical protein